MGEQAGDPHLQGCGRVWSWQLRAHSAEGDIPGGEEGWVLEQEVLRAGPGRQTKGVPLGESPDGGLHTDPSGPGGRAGGGQGSLARL